MRRHVLYFTWIACALLTSATNAEAVSPEATERPNIVLILGDDHGWPYYGFMGSSIVETPNLDTLAKSGTLFPYTYNTASVCRPALRSILTGLYPQQYEIRATKIASRNRSTSGTRGEPMTEFATLPRVLAAAGYATFQAGKLWDGTYADSGFTGGMTATLQEASTHYTGNLAGKQLGRKTLDPVFEFLRAPREGPFFLWFAPQLPHAPHNAPAKFSDRYGEKDLVDGARRYYANCTWEDAVVGQLLDFLDSEDLRENTLIVYLSDNGWEQPPSRAVVTHLGGRHGKTSMHELGFRTPLIFSWPGHLPGDRRVDDLVSTVDLFPTLVDFAGAKAPSNLPGIDLGPIVRGRTDESPRERMIGGQFVTGDARLPAPFKKYSGDAYYLREGDWYYILWGGNLNRQKLFDKKADPEELTDVSLLHPERARAYRERVLDWLDETGIGRKRLGWTPGWILRRRAPPKPSPASAPTTNEAM
ncbi:MAG: sulfatase-like hydrolase/transferase [Candidatus Binatia bacterium]|nr:sulfatase-like hydrolase/transferase [Candidatus Binatia bacterium]